MARRKSATIQPDPEDARTLRRPATRLFVSTDPDLGEEGYLFQDSKRTDQPLVADTGGKARRAEVRGA